MDKISRYLSYYEENNFGDSILGVAFLYDKISEKFYYFSPRNAPIDGEIEYLTTSLQFVYKDKDNKIVFAENASSYFSDSKGLIIDDDDYYLSNKLGTKKMIVPIDIFKESVNSLDSLFYTFVKLNIFTGKLTMLNTFIDLKNNKSFEVTNNVVKRLLKENDRYIKDDLNNLAKMYSFIYNRYTSSVDGRLNWNL